MHKSRAPTYMLRIYTSRELHAAHLNKSRAPCRAYSKSRGTSAAQLKSRGPSAAHYKKSHLPRNFQTSSGWDPSDLLGPRARSSERGSTNAVSSVTGLLSSTTDSRFQKVMAPAPRITTSRGTSAEQFKLPRVRISKHSSCDLRV